MPGDDVVLMLWKLEEESGHLPEGPGNFSRRENQGEISLERIQIRSCIQGKMQKEHYKEFQRKSQIKKVQGD